MLRSDQRVPDRNSGVTLSVSVGGRHVLEAWVSRLRILRDQLVCRATISAELTRSLETRCESFLTSYLHCRRGVIPAAGRDLNRNLLPGSVLPVSLILEGND